LDLRGFRPPTSGCDFELRQLAASGLSLGTVFVINDAADVRLLELAAGQPDRQQRTERRALAPACNRLS
jgi:hypothetical protein